MVLSPHERKKLGWHAGWGGKLIAAGNPALAGARFAPLYILRERKDSGGHEKGISTRRYR